VLNSLDTNILLYALNADCREHQSALQIVEQALGSPEEWIVADQVYFELYRLIRNPVVLEHPLDAAQAASKILFFRDECGWQHCHYEGVFMDSIQEWLSKESFGPANVFDLVLAATLRGSAVRRFYTRNKSDYEYLNWFEVIDPISVQASPSPPAPAR